MGSFATLFNVYADSEFFSATRTSVLRLFQLFRTDFEFTQTELAEKIGISQSALSKLLAKAEYANFNEFKQDLKEYRLFIQEAPSLVSTFSPKTYWTVCTSLFQSDTFQNPSDYWTAAQACTAAKRLFFFCDKTYDFDYFQADLLLSGREPVVLKSVAEFELFKPSFSKDDLIFLIQSSTVADDLRRVSLCRLAIPTGITLFSISNENAVVDPGFRPIFNPFPNYWDSIGISSVLTLIGLLFNYLNAK